MSSILLRRVTPLHDFSNSESFIFTIPSKLTRGFLSDASSREFIHANQKFLFKMEHENGALNVFLKLTSGSAGMRVRVDCQVTVLSRDHFQYNLVFPLGTLEFTGALHQPGTLQGKRALIDITTLCGPHQHFLFDNSLFLVELELRNALSQFHDEIPLGKEILRQSSESGGTNTPWEVEFSCFTYGGCDWSVRLDSGSQRLTIIRNNRLEHWCKVRCRLQLHLLVGNNTERHFDSGVVEQFLDLKGIGKHILVEKSFIEGVQQASVGSGKSNKMLAVDLDLFSFCHTSLVELQPISQERNFASCFDATRCEWLLRSDILGSKVKVHFSVKNAAEAHLPEGHVRQVVWNTALVPHDRAKPPLPSLTRPHWTYIASDTDVEEGHEVAFDLPVAEVCDSGAGYADPLRGVILIQTDWLNSHLLSEERYDSYDDLIAMQRSQMRQALLEVQAPMNPTDTSPISNYHEQPKANKRADGPNHDKVAPEESPASPRADEPPPHKSAGGHHKRCQQPDLSQSQLNEKTHGSATLTERFRSSLRRSFKELSTSKSRHQQQPQPAQPAPIPTIVHATGMSPEQTQLPSSVSAPPSASQFRTTPAGHYKEKNTLAVVTRPMPTSSSSAYLAPEGNQGGWWEACDEHQEPCVYRSQSLRVPNSPSHNSSKKSLAGANGQQLSPPGSPANLTSGPTSPHRRQQHLSLRRTTVAEGRGGVASPTRHLPHQQHQQQHHQQRFA